MQEPSTKKREKRTHVGFCSVLFPFWMNMASTHNLMCCFGKFSLWELAVITSYSNMHGCVKIPGSLFFKVNKTSIET